MRDKRKLIIRHFPTVMSKEDVLSFMRTLNAQNVTWLKRCGRAKSAILVSFDDEHLAETALKKLHQFELFGKFLSVHYATLNKPISGDSQEPVPIKQGASVKHDKDEELLAKLHSLQSDLGLNYVANPMLRYLYPPPNTLILSNIAAVLSSTPSFYFQVLHLMNKMNLPAPFERSLVSKFGHVDIFEHSFRLPSEMANVSSEEESELEDEPSGVTNSQPRKTINLPRLRKPTMKHSLPTREPSAETSSAMHISEVFEAQPPSKKMRQINLAPPNELNKPDSCVSDAAPEPAGSFGVLEKAQIEPIQPDTADSSSYDWTIEFITPEQLSAKRMSNDDMNALAIFKNYQKGDPSKRLYVKNVAKSVTEKGLFKIFGSFVGATEMERDAFDVRLMTSGRMKGQAFVSYADQSSAEKALSSTNSYVLEGKPLVVQFARTAQAKS